MTEQLNQLRARIAALWDAKHNTADIAHVLNLSEALIERELHSTKERRREKSA